MKLLLMLSLFLTMFAYSAQAEENTASEPEDEISLEDIPVFKNIQDRTMQLNQQYSNNLIQSPFNSPFAQGRFVPDIAFIMDFSYAHRNAKHSAYEDFYVPGFTNLDPHAAHEGLNKNNGFNFNYGELSLGSTVDPYFDLFTNFHLSEAEFEIEEAYISTRTLPFGLQLKAGKFFSSFGRLNSQHAHYWDFADQPVIYNKLLGTHGINEKGLQLNWLAPLDTYLLFGAELFSGENAQSFGKNGFQEGTYQFDEVDYPNLINGFIKSSLDFDNLIILGGLSLAQGGTRAVLNAEEGDMHVHALSQDELSGNLAGNSRIYAADLTLKYLIDPYRYLAWQSEYLHRSTQGSLYRNSERLSINKEQGGFYSQLVWKFGLQWRAGLRYELLTGNNIEVSGQNAELPGLLPKYTAMIDFNPTEFSRIRLQYNYDQTNYSVSQAYPLHEVFLQLNMAVGAHGAHKF